MCIPPLLGGKAIRCAPWYLSCFIYMSHLAVPSTLWGWTVTARRHMVHASGSIPDVYSIAISLSRISSSPPPTLAITKVDLAVDTGLPRPTLSSDFFAAPTIFTCLSMETHSPVASSAFHFLVIWPLPLVGYLLYPDPEPLSESPQSWLCLPWRPQLLMGAVYAVNLLAGTELLSWRRIEKLLNDRNQLKRSSVAILILGFPSCKHHTTPCTFHESLVPLLFSGHPASLLSLPWVFFSDSVDTSMHTIFLDSCLLPPLL